MDANGDELTLYEYEQPQPTIMGLNRTPTTRLALDTGEEVMRVDDHNFVIVSSGEKLIQIG